MAMVSHARDELDDPGIVAASLDDPEAFGELSYAEIAAALDLPLGLFTVPKQLGTYRRQWIVDPANGTLLAIRDLVAKPPHGSRPLPPGDNGRPRSLKAANMPDRFHRPGELASYEVFEVSEWTNAEPRP
ncbi:MULTISPECIES: hypothetical protein [Actinomadura]|uniref:Uncharacterized protein n=1 Tax=Actinomadura yumaensis TaxID=111807 RepID=A0ABW2CE01_9ACTN|nr:hypothetical protein [Actinomadura sp. J1-007]MWK38250.1 hypothetical protein [Actinomadura sp. J1-007]